jgi:uncharacterized protein YndB with AHSA1/START domain
MSVTTNQPSVIDSGEFTVRRTVTIAAPIDKVWAAITEAEHIARWFPNRVVLDTVAPGASGVFTWDDFGDIPVRIEELDPPRMIAYRWSNDSANAENPERVDFTRSTVFRFTLEPRDDGTQLTVVESGFDALTDPAASMESNRGGWDSELDELVAYLESGS